jgi:hypothetical protein
MFNIQASDPDAPFTPNTIINYGDTGDLPESGEPVPCRTQYGPWTPPASEPGSVQRYTGYPYKAPGTYTVKWTFTSRAEYGGCEDPYGESVVAMTTVTVTA